jgi:PadR family transcriptional regulator AphA
VAAVGLTPGEWAVLGVVAESPTHGFAVTALLGKEGELGRIWTVPRPLVYHALKKLAQHGLVRDADTQPSSQGPTRTIVAATAEGDRLVAEWLSAPVEHVRDVRSLLLLKLALLDRRGVDPQPLLRAQRRLFLPMRAERERWRDDAEGFERVLAQWRLLSVQTVLDFLDSVGQ